MTDELIFKREGLGLRLHGRRRRDGDDLAGLHALRRGERRAERLGVVGLALRAVGVVDLRHLALALAGGADRVLLARLYAGAGDVEPERDPVLRDRRAERRRRRVGDGGQVGRGDRAAADPHGEAAAVVVVREGDVAEELVGDRDRFRVEGLAAVGGVRVPQAGAVLRHAPSPPSET